MLFLSLLLNIVQAESIPTPAIDVVFWCRTSTGDKNIALFKQGNNFIYQYGGDMSKPELQLLRSNTEVVKEPWNGVGMQMWNNITLKNGDYAYTVRAAYGRGEDMTITAGVDITKNDEYVTSVQCKTDSEFIDRLSSFVE